MANIVSNALYMAPNGRDSNTGAIDSPLATINGAINKGLGSGKYTLYVRGGEYTPSVQETINIAGTEANRITIELYPNDSASAKFNLKKFPFSNSNVSNAAFIFIQKGKYLTFKNLEFYGKTGLDYINGIVCIGTSSDVFSNITIDNCYFHDMGGTKLGKMISFEAIKGIKSYNCKVLNCRFENIQNGNTETVRANGLVDGFEVANCKFTDVSNIGVDCLGNYYNYGQSSNAYIHDNVFTRTGIGNDHDPAAIYFDGGKNGIVENNIINNCATGFGICCENLTGGDVTGIIFRNNTINDWFCHAIHLGSYTSGVKVNIKDNTISGNTITQSTTNAPMIAVYKIAGITITDNNFNINSNVIIEVRKQADTLANSNITFTDNRIYKVGADENTVLFKEMRDATTSMTLKEFTSRISNGTGNSINPSIPSPEDDIFITLANLRVFKAKLLEEINKSKS